MYRWGLRVTRVSPVELIRTCSLMQQQPKFATISDFHFEKDKGHWPSGSISIAPELELEKRTRIEKS